MIARRLVWERWPRALAYLWVWVDDKREEPLKELVGVGRRLVAGSAARREAADEAQHARQRAAQHERLLRVRVRHADERRGDARRLRDEQRARDLRESPLEQGEHAGVDGGLGARLRRQAHHQRAQVRHRRPRHLLRIEDLLDDSEDDILLEEFGGVGLGVMPDIGIQVVDLAH